MNIVLMDERTRKILPLVALLVVAVLSSVALGSLVLHYLLEKPATVTISSNYYTIQLYEDEGLTEIASSIYFPSIMFGDEQGMISQSQIYYLNGVSIEASRPVTLTWSCDASQYGEEIVITCSYFDGSVWADWVIEEGVIILTSTDPTALIQFTCDAANAYINGYPFNVAFQALSDG